MVIADYKPGDRIRADKPFGQSTTAVILEVRLADSAWVVRVWNEDKKIEDVWVWNRYQDGKTIHKISGEN